MDQKAPIAKPEELADYDAIIFGCGTRYGTMASQMRNFIDQTGPLWAKQALMGKVGSAMTSSATQHGVGINAARLHPNHDASRHGVVGLPYTYAGQSGVDASVAASYGASTITFRGSRQPSSTNWTAPSISKARRHDRGEAGK
jgi:NAD(P)H dehydrogenase (quinone)